MEKDNFPVYEKVHTAKPNHHLKYSRFIPASLRTRWENQMELSDSMVGCQYWISLSNSF